jgi:hypothetical protein
VVAPVSALIYPLGKQVYFFWPEGVFTFGHTLIGVYSRESPNHLAVLGMAGDNPNFPRFTFCTDGFLPKQQTKVAGLLDATVTAYAVFVD